MTITTPAKSLTGLDSFLNKKEAVEVPKPDKPKGGPSSSSDSKY